MGTYLSSPRDEKISRNGSCDEFGIRWAVSEMQGWRVEMEDASLICAPLPKESPMLGFFGVFDGHGGPHIARFVAGRFLSILLSSSAFYEGDFEYALKNTYLYLDSLLSLEDYQKELASLLSHNANILDSGSDKVEVENDVQMLQDSVNQNSPVDEPGSVKYSEQSRLQAISDSSPILTQREFIPSEPTVAPTATCIENANDNVKNKMFLDSIQSKVNTETSKTNILQVDSRVNTDYSYPKKNVSLDVKSIKTSNLKPIDLCDSNTKSTSDNLFTPTPSYMYSQKTVTFCEDSITKNVSTDKNLSSALKTDKNKQNLCADICEDTNGMEKFKACKYNEGNQSSPPKTQSRPTAVSHLHLFQTPQDLTDSFRNATPFLEKVQFEATRHDERLVERLSNLMSDRSALKRSKTTPIRLRNMKHEVDAHYEGSNNQSKKGNWHNKGASHSHSRKSMSYMPERAMHGRSDKSEYTNWGTHSHSASYRPASPKCSNRDAKSDGMRVSRRFGIKNTISSLMSNAGRLLGIGKYMRSNECHNSLALLAGCTAVTCMITTTEIIVANAGDSRCVLCRDGVAIDLSADHKPQNPEEKERIYAAGGYLKMGRINGNLNLSRAIGDLFYKRDANLPPHKQIVTSFPDVTFTKRTDEDEFLVIGCDGIWEQLSSQDVISFVRERINERSSLSNILEELFQHILSPDPSIAELGCDNMTAILIDVQSHNRAHLSQSTAT